MRAGIILQTIQRRVAKLPAGMGREAGRLLKRRGLQYALLAIVLAAGAIYANAALPTSAGTDSPHKPAHDITLQKETPEAVTDHQTQSDVGVTDTESSSETNNHTSTSITVDGQDIPVPDNGDTHTVITDGDTTTSVNVSHSSSGSEDTRTRLRIRVHSHSYSSEEVNTTD